MGAPLPFFQLTESGRITSRFSSDFDSIDLVIPASLSSFMDAGDCCVLRMNRRVGRMLLLVLAVAVVVVAESMQRLTGATKISETPHFFFFFFLADLIYFLPICFSFSFSLSRPNPGPG